MGNSMEKVQLQKNHRIGRNDCGTVTNLVSNIRSQNNLSFDW